MYCVALVWFTTQLSVPEAASIVLVHTLSFVNANIAPVLFINSEILYEAPVVLLYEQDTDELLVTVLLVIVQLCWMFWSVLCGNVTLAVLTGTISWHTPEEQEPVTVKKFVEPMLVLPLGV